MTGIYNDFLTEWETYAKAFLSKEKEGVDINSYKAVTNNAIEIFIESFFNSERPLEILELAKEFIEDYCGEEDDHETTLSDCMAKHYNDIRLNEDFVSKIYEDERLDEYLINYDDEVIMFEHMILGFIEGESIAELKDVLLK